MEKVFVVTLKRSEDDKTPLRLLGVVAVFATRGAALRYIADMFFNYVEFSAGKVDIEITNHGGRIKFVDNSVERWEVEEQEVL